MNNEVIHINIWLWYGLAAGIFLLFVPGRPMYMAVFLIAIIHWGIGWVSRRAFSRITIERNTDTIYLFPGDYFTITTIITNSSCFPFGWVFGRDRVPTSFQKQRKPMVFTAKTDVSSFVRSWGHTDASVDSDEPSRRSRPEQGWVLSLAPKEAVTAAYEVRAGSRGHHTIGPLQIFAGDSLGVHKHTRADTTLQPVVVYPRVHPLDQLDLPAQLPLGNLRPKHSLHPDPARLKGVRPYQPGDPMRMIHWQATARTQQLQVRELERTASMDAVVLLDFAEQSYSVQDFATVSELAIETAASLCNYLADKKESFCLWSNAPVGTIPLASGHGQLMKILTSLAGLTLAPAQPFPNWLDEAGAGIPWGASVLIVTPRDTEAVVERCLQLKRRGFQVLPFVTGSKVVHPQLLHSGAPLRTYRVRYDGDLLVEGGA